MIQNSSRRPILLSALGIALAIASTYATAQSKTTTKTTSTPTTSTPTTGAPSPQGVTGTDPTPIQWPPSLKLSLRMQ